jgi:hypothetical protein
MKLGCFDLVSRDEADSSDNRLPVSPSARECLESFEHAELESAKLG